MMRRCLNYDAESRHPLILRNIYLIDFQSDVNVDCRMRRVSIAAKGLGAEGGTRTPTSYLTRPSNVRVCQFRHFGIR